jgi:hypothetical protein
MDTVKERFQFDDLETSTTAAMWVWDHYIVPLQAELKEAEERADDAISGFNKGLDY